MRRRLNHLIVALAGRLSVVAAIAAVNGCALLPRAAAPPELPLLAPATLGAPHDASQVLHASFDDTRLTLQCALRADASAVTLVAVGPLGQRVFSVRYDGAAVEAQASPFVPLDLPPRQVLSDVQLALWPLAAWQRALIGSAWQIDEPEPGTRRLRYRGRVVVEVRYEVPGDPWRSRLRLDNRPLRYSLQIEPQAPSGFE